MSSALADSPTAPRIAKAILIGGLLGGACDLLFAILYFGSKGAPTTRIFQTIAGGVLGPSTYSGGYTTAALGFFLHFLVSFIIAAIYVFATRRFPLLLRRAIVCGLLYGIAVYYAMNMIVVPLSAFRKSPLPVPFDLPSILVHALGVGLPIALAARHFLAARDRQ